MKLKRVAGLGVLPAVVIPLIGAIGSIFGGIFGGGKPKGPSAAEILAMQRQQQEAERQRILWIAAGGVFLVFAVMAMRR